MIRHIFKLMWNRKGKNLLLITEIFFSFLVLFGVLSLLLFYFTNYRQDLGFEYKNVWNVAIDTKASSEAEQYVLKEQILKKLRSYPQVDVAGMTRSNMPYSFSTSNFQIQRDKAKTMSHHISVDENYDDVWSIKMKEGRWFNEYDAASGIDQVVITQQVRDKLFPGESAVGKIITTDDWGTEEKEKLKVIGVIGNFKLSGEYDEAEPGVFFLMKDSSRFTNEIVLKLKPGTGIEFESKMMKDLASIARTWSFETKTLEKMREVKMKSYLIPVIALGVISAFLIFNVALGLFGILWYNINSRYSEIGIRRAVGATGNSINWQFIGEVFVMTTFGITIACFIAFQFPMLNAFNLESGIYINAIIGSVLFIYLITIICAFYPSRQAAVVEPAVALRDQ